MDLENINVFQRLSDGTVEQLTPPNGRYYLACIRPDGNYAVCQGGGFDDHLRIWRIEVASRKLECISPEGISGQMPSYSWSGSLVVFSSESKPESKLSRIRDMPAFFGPRDTIPMAIRICEHDGSNIKQLTSGDYMDVRPTFSPDGTMVAFISKRTGTWKLWEVPTDGASEPELLPGEYAWAMRPWYSADGTEIFFHTDVEERHTIVRYDRQRGTIRPLPNDDLGHTRGSFTLKRDQAILAHSNRSGAFGIWKFPLDGGTPVEIAVDRMEIAGHPSMSEDGLLIFDSPCSFDRS